MALFFGAQWRPPCHPFTPMLKRFYNKVSKTEDFEVVFISSDRTEKDLEEYLEEHGDWLYLPFGHEHIE